jgi:hypothetical protein
VTTEQCDVLPIYEEAYPGDRRAIKAAQLYLLDPCDITSKMAGEAAHAAPDRAAAHKKMGKERL